MPPKKLPMSAVKTEQPDISDAAAQDGSPSTEITPLPVSKWEKIEELSDDTTTVEVCNITGPVGTGSQDCLMRFVNPVSREMVGAPVLFEKKFASNGKLRS